MKKRLPSELNKKTKKILKKELTLKYIMSGLVNDFERSYYMIQRLIFVLFCLLLNICCFSFSTNFFFPVLTTFSFFVDYID